MTKLDVVSVLCQSLLSSSSPSRIIVFNGPWACSSCVMPELATFVFHVKNQNVQCFLAYNSCVMPKLIVFMFPINN
jgi:hypothetical protein